jgi:hypothetical protein
MFTTLLAVIQCHALVRFALRFAPLADIGFHGIGIGQLVIYAIIVAGIVAVLYVVLQKLGVAIPGWVIQLFWIVVVVVVGVFVVRFLMSLL